MQDHVKASINETQCKTINNMLQRNTPAVLIMMLETVVALMRNHKVANNIDIEIYFKDFKKLQKKMMTLDPAPFGEPERAFTLEVVEMHEAALEKQANQVQADWPKYSSILQWGLLFCKYAKDKISQATKERELDKVSKELQVAVDHVDTQSQIESLFVSDSSSSQADVSGLRERFAQIQQMVEADKQQALQYQKALDAYDADFQNDLSMTRM